MSENMCRLCIVVPCFNEEEALPRTAGVLLKEIGALIQSGRISQDSKILFVDDGSRDKTWKIVTSLHEKDEHFSALKLSRNEGHQNALFAGLMTVRDEFDAAISIDADLQDDVSAIGKMVDEFYAGADIVYGVRSSRKQDSFFKRTTALGFYKFMNALGAQVIYNHADYRLMSARAIKGLEEFREVNLFLRGLVPMIGYKTATVEYERGKRLEGVSKYPLKKMLSFAWQGITSMSEKPIHIISTLGFLLMSGGLISLLVLIIRLIAGLQCTDVFKILSPVVTLFGLTVLSIGIVGEYVGKTYLEVKHRPKYFTEKYLH